MKAFGNTTTVGALLNADSLRDTVRCPGFTSQVRQQGGQRRLATFNPGVDEVRQVDQMVMGIDDLHLA